MARAKGEASKVYCARVKADIFEPVERIKQSGVRVSDLIREGLRKEISARSPFEKQAIKELQAASSPAAVVEIAAALVEVAETRQEESFVEKAATAALDAVAGAPLQLTAPKYRNFYEEVTNELRKAKTLDEYRATYDRLFKEAKRLGSTATKAFYLAQREARAELDAALKLKREQAKQLAKLQKAQAKAAKPKKTPAPKKPKAPKAKPAPKPKAEKKPAPKPKAEKKKSSDVKKASSRGERMPRIRPTKEQKEIEERIKGFEAALKLSPDVELMFERDRQEATIERAERDGRAELARMARRFLALVDAEIEKRTQQKKSGPEKKGGESCSNEKAPLLLGSKTSAGLEKIPARYCLVDVYDLKTSNKPLSGFGYSEGYPRDAQERDYFNDKTEQLKVSEIARNFEPALVFNGNPGAIDGMPVVNQDGLVLGGNGRTMAGMVAYSEGDQAQKIRDYLKDNAKIFGFTARQIAKVPYPFLVRRIQTGNDPQELAAWSRRLNETLSQQLDKTALAVSRAKFLPASVLQALKIPDDASVGAWLSSQESKPFVEGLKSVGVIDARNFKTFIDPQTGLLSADGRDVVTELIVAVLIPDAQLLKSLGPGMAATIARGAPYLAEMRTWTGSPYDLSGQLVQALRAFVDWRSMGSPPIMGYLSQGSLLGAQRSKIVNVWLKTLHDLAASPVKFMRVCRGYATEARGPANGQVALFAAEARTPAQMLQAAAAKEGVSELSYL